MHKPPHSTKLLAILVMAGAFITFPGPARAADKMETVTYGVVSWNPLHWVVIAGTAKIVNGEQEMFLEENQSTYIPKTHRHRLENSGKIPLQIIEIQSGPYLEEDDIVRFDDIYGRD